MIGRDGRPMTIIMELCDDQHRHARRERNISEHPCEKLAHSGKLDQQQWVAYRLFLSDWTATRSDGSREVGEYVDTSIYQGLSSEACDALDRLNGIARRTSKIGFSVLSFVVGEGREPGLFGGNASYAIGVLKVALDCVSEFYDSRVIGSQVDVA